MRLILITTVYVLRPAQTLFRARRELCQTEYSFNFAVVRKSYYAPPKFERIFSVL